MLRITDEIGMLFRRKKKEKGLTKNVGQFGQSNY